MRIGKFTPGEARIALVTAVGAIGLGIAQLAAPTNAVAASGVQQVVGSTAPSRAAKTLTVRCPAGTTATGAFGAIGGVTRGVHIDRLWPQGDTVRIHATPLPSVSRRWRISGGATCVTATTDVEYRASGAAPASRASDDDQRFGVAVRAECPSGKELIGLGGTAVGGRLTHLQPLGPGVPYTGEPAGPGPVHGVSVIGHTYAEGRAHVSIQAMAVCANTGHGTRVEFAETVSTATEKTVAAGCGVGRQIHATGAIITYPNHYAEKTPFSFALLNTLNHRADGLMGSLRVTRHVDDVPTETWGVGAYGICASS